MVGGLLISAPLTYLLFFESGIYHSLKYRSGLPQIVVIAAVGIGVFCLAMGVWTVARLLPERGRRRAIRDAFARRDAVEVTEISALRADASAPLRVRGRVGSEVAGDPSLLRIIDEAGTEVAVRITASARAWDGAGPRSVLDHGDSVEIVGRGHSRRGAREPAELVFSDDEPVDIFLSPRV